MAAKIQKIILPLGIVFAFIILVYLFFLRFGGQKPPFEPKTFPTPTPVQVSKKIIVSGIKMNNFTSQPKEIDKKGDVLFEKTKDFDFVYLKPFNIFLITVLSRPFEDKRQIAEKAFLENLGISEKDACKLEVWVSTPNFVDPENSGQKYPLSFCQQK